MNLDPHVWFDNVEKTVSLLSRPEYAARARYGAFRSWETVQYVRDIVARYRAYSRLAERRGETGSAERPISR
jgi:membrane-bound lytic murein transglycosylase MltF